MINCLNFVISTFQLAMKASRNLHNLMYNGVTRATMYFFNTNPSGRILNRFSKDMGQIDEMLPAVMIDVIQIFLQLFGIIIVVAVVNYWFLIPTVIIGFIFYFLRNFYLKSSRNIKRMEATSKFNISDHLFHHLATFFFSNNNSSIANLFTSGRFANGLIDDSCIRS